MVPTERRDGVLLVGLDRPAKRNALDADMADELHAVLDEANQSDPAVLVLHSTTPGMFVSGADIGELIERDADAALRGINALLFEKLEAYRWPSIAAIDGPAFGGGCEMALACDLRICSPAARFAQPEPNLGIIAGAGANWRLAPVVGLATARRMLYTGLVLDADAAHAAGLVESIHASEQLLDAAVDVAATIGERSWRALELTKLALASHRQPTTTFDIAAQALLFESDDKHERMQAFLDRRKTR